MFWAIFGLALTLEKFGVSCGTLSPCGGGVVGLQTVKTKATRIVKGMTGADQSSTLRCLIQIEESESKIIITCRMEKW